MRIYIEIVDSVLLSCGLLARQLLLLPGNLSDVRA
jgi:hypothetical protein